MASDDRLKVPGFGRTLVLEEDEDEDLYDDRFDHAISDYFAISLVTLREKAMVDFINKITDKPRWWEKVFNEEIVAKWRSECGTEEQQKFYAKNLNQKCFDYCITELRDKATHHQQYGVVSVLDVMASVSKADPVQDSFWNILRDAVKPLENIRDKDKDWHPGSDGLVLDLVHPSLFPVEYGKTKVLPTGTVPRETCISYAGAGETCPDQDGYIGPEHHYGSYQWLPTDVQFDKDGHATLQGYVNNIHPKHHAHIYPVLEKAVEKAIPLWNECLRMQIDAYSSNERLRIRSDGSRLSHDDFQRPNDIPDEDWNDWLWDQGSSIRFADRNSREWEESLERLENPPPEIKLIQPTVTEDYVPVAERHEHPLYDLPSKFTEGYQIIFKLANIHLTPDKPTYSGSNWHVEGALNEHICGTALFYYDQENIADSYLEFRQRLNEVDMDLESRCSQGEYLAAEYMYGITQDGPKLQHLGRVLTRSERIVAFPNVLQHRVTPFSLQEPSKPGHRKILAMFLVDPHIKVLSTSNVPPQRRDWWAEEVQKVPPFHELPVEIFDQIIEEVEDFPISWEDACEAREALMAERGGINDKVDEEWQEDTFNFCEH